MPVNPIDNDNNTDVSLTEAKLDFIKSSQSNTKTDSEKGADVYADFFDTSTTSSNQPQQKPKRAPIEITVSILGYSISFLVIVLILLTVHVFIRTQERSTIAENYKFLCPYFNYGIDIEGKECKTFLMIADDYNQKANTLQKGIVELLTAYIPVKVSRSLVDASPEKSFIVSTYEKKIDVIAVMNQFQKVRQNAQYADLNNIECLGINIEKDYSFTTQCTVYGGAFGEGGDDGKLSSARIETLKFLDILGNTPKSQFRLLNPPSSLSVEKLNTLTSNAPPVFQTRTTIPLQLIYVPFDTKN